MLLIKIKRNIIYLLIFSLLSFSLMPYQSFAKEAAPQISYQLSNKKIQDGKLQINIAIEDKQGIKNVKYAMGVHRKPFFRYSFYKKKVQNVKLSSTSKLSFELGIDEGGFVTIYADNKKGLSSLKVIKVKKQQSLANTKPTSPDNTNIDNTKSANTLKTEQETENKKEDKKVNNTQQEGKVQTKKQKKKIEKNEKKRFKISDGPSPNNYNVYNERRSVWVSYLELKKAGYTEQGFRDRANEILNDMVSRKMNTLYFHVRPFSDAMYKSKYFPWSTYASGKEGKDPGFDPLSIMVKEAHNRGIKIHAFINPYRVNYASIFEGLKKDPLNYKWKNPAYRWRNDTDETNDRNVLKHGNMYFYNPSKPEVINLITNGVREICENYDVDGVIFDDYFYPTLGENYKENFDSEEYDEYETEMEESGNKALSIVEWRRENINTMVKSVFSAVKGVGKNQEFGISPAGNIKNLESIYAYYVDINKWCREPGFIDYIEPQQYWGFDNESVPFEKNVARWKNLIKNPNMKLYFAISISNLEAQPDEEWRENVDILGAMLQNLRYQDIKGFSLFRYDYTTDKFLRKKGAKEGRDIFFEQVK